MKVGSLLYNLKFHLYTLYSFFLAKINPVYYGMAKMFSKDIPQQDMCAL